MCVTTSRKYLPAGHRLFVAMVPWTMRHFVTIASGQLLSADTPSGLVSFWLLRLGFVSYCFDCFDCLVPVCTRIRSLVWRSACARPRTKMGAGRGHPDLSAQLTLLLNSLDTFPPAVNRYNIVAKALEVQFAYKMPAWVTILLFVYIGLFGM